MNIPSPSDTDSLLASFGKLALLFVLMLVGSLWGGYVLSILWRWFVVPLGLSALTTNAAIGVSVVASYLTRGSIKWDDDKQLQWGKACWLTAFVPAWFLFCGWVLHSVFPVTS